ncbi:hypothetical protein SADUNF_Sadunf03G0072600 [Salix dunnii]|uniref:Uncharacterized protein n=1 Tax=Salix dunnii TaxID=1413687 RepID=A0A835N3C4_9ROSI|nr:hypothetical protein SADUNF_Sadunf03G0072600 [Salix dunnii]
MKLTKQTGRDASVSSDEWKEIARDCKNRPLRQNSSEIMEYQMTTEKRGCRSIGSRFQELQCTSVPVPSNINEFFILAEIMEIYQNCRICS